MEKDLHTTIIDLSFLYDNFVSRVYIYVFIFLKGGKIKCTT